MFTPLSDRSQVPRDEFSIIQETLYEGVAEEAVFQILVDYGVVPGDM